MNRAAIDWATETVLDNRDEELSAGAVLFLLREYVAGGADGVRSVLERGLTCGLATVDADADTFQRLQWLRVFAEAAALSDDERLHQAVSRTLPSAIDALEGLVRRTYEPGEGLLASSCGAHVRCGSALLAAFDLSGRLPYAMLAEELQQHARRQWWSDDTAVYDADFGDNCAALHVLCRLAELHADAEYRAAAVLAPGASYPLDARRMAAALTARSGAHPKEAGDFGRALLEWFALESNLQ